MSVPEGITALESAAREWQKDKVRLETANVQLERARLELESERMKLTEIIDQQRARISLLEKELAEYRTGARSDIVAATSDVSSSASPASPAQNSGDDLMPNVATSPHASSTQTPDESSSQKAQKSKDKSSKRKSNKANKSKSKDKSGDPTSTTKKKRKGSYLIVLGRYAPRFIFSFFGCETSKFNVFSLPYRLNTHIPIQNFLKNVFNDFWSSFQSDPRVFPRPMRKLPSLPPRLLRLQRLPQSPRLIKSQNLPLHP
jgi:hypothetical protein